MKKLINVIRKSIVNLVTDDDPTTLWIQIPNSFKTKKDQNFVIRKTKNFILEQTSVEK